MDYGDSPSGDYFVDCGSASVSVLRAIFGAWITICVAIVAISLRSVYCSLIKRRLFKGDKGAKPISLWNVTPAQTPSEVFTLRRKLARNLRQGQYLYVIISLVCVLAAITSSLSTTIANRTIVTNKSNRTVAVSGRLAGDGVGVIQRPVGTIALTLPRIRALENAGAPLDQFFDFLPDDTSGWVYRAEEWNNTWQGRCTYALHPAVDLVVYPSVNSTFQDEVPLLGSWLPAWATVGHNLQGVQYNVWRFTSPSNDSGYFQDCVITYAFFTAGTDVENAPYLNVSFANILLHNVGAAPPRSGQFVQTAFKSDVHVVDCMFNNSKPEFPNQAFPVGSGETPPNFAVNVAAVFQQSFYESAATMQPIRQATAQEMLRAAQAYISVKNTLIPLPVQRLITVDQRVVQIRLSVLISTIGACVFALSAALIFQCIEPRDAHGKRLTLPDSQLGWAVQATYEYYWGRGAPFTPRNPVTFLAQHDDLILLPQQTAGGRFTARVTSLADLSAMSSNKRTSTSAQPDPWLEYVRERE